MVPQRQAPQPRPPAQRRSARRRGAVRLLAAGIGVAAGLSLLGALWPEADRGQQEEGLNSASALGEVPNQAVTVLVIGSDAESRDDKRNGAAPPGPANSDALLLVQVRPNGPVQVLSLPIETAVQLPGTKAPVALGSLYRRGGPALVAGAAAELVGLPQGQPQRYLVLPRSALRDLVDGLGRVELAPDRSMSYRDKAQNLRIQLEGGLQLMDGRQVEQLLRFRDRERGDEGRRDRQLMAVESLLRQMGQRQQLAQLPGLVNQLQGQVDTNLSRTETLSLLAAVLQANQPAQLRSLPLKPPIKPGDPLRQLAPEALPQAWQN